MVLVVSVRLQEHLLQEESDKKRTACIHGIDPSETSSVHPCLKTFSLALQHIDDLLACPHASPSTCLCSVSLM